MYVALGQNPRAMVEIDYREWQPSPKRYQTGFEPQAHHQTSVVLTLKASFFLCKSAFLAKRQKKESNLFWILPLGKCPPWPVRTLANIQNWRTLVRTKRDGLGPGANKEFKVARLSKKNKVLWFLATWKTPKTSHRPDRPSFTICLLALILASGAGSGCIYLATLVPRSSQWRRLPSQ